MTGCPYGPLKRSTKRYPSSSARPQSCFPNLPLHLVWSVTLSQAERGCKVAGKEWLLLDGGKDSLVNGLLVGSAAARWLLGLQSCQCDSLKDGSPPYLWLLALLEELLLSLLLVTLLSGEVLLSRNLLDLGGVNTGDVNLLRSGDNVASVHSAEWDTVDLEWTSNEENALLEVLKKDDTLAAETTGEKDENGTWGEGGSWGGGTDGLANLDRIVSILCSHYFAPAIVCGIPRTTRLRSRAIPTTPPSDPSSPSHPVFFNGERTFFGADSSSAGYHLLAFWLWCGTCLVDFPKVFSE